MQNLKKNKFLFFLLLLSLIGGIFRFYNLNWGSPFYFHPDERNIASSIAGISFPNQLNPHFFAYGSFPIYLVYFTGFLINLFHKSNDIFIQSVLISRFYSACLSTLLIPSIYFLGKRGVNKKVGLISSIFCALSVGFVQFAHFGTVEMWLTFLGVWLFYFSLGLIKNLTFKNAVIVGIIFGLLMATKISSLPLFLIPGICMAINFFTKTRKEKIRFFLKLITLIFISLIVFSALSPYIYLDYNSFLSSMKYESSVALGTLPVFYTGEFFNSIPVFFQFVKVYPFLINPILTALFIPSFIYILILYFQKKNFFYLLIIISFLLLFLPQAFLFTKWTRYMIPTLPFVYLIIAVTLEKLISKKMLILIILSSLVFYISYFITAFVKPDTRIEASFWAKENIPAKSIVLSEVYDMGIVPFNRYLQNISLFNFYDLDQIPEIKSEEINDSLNKNRYIILPSPRILKTRLLNKEKFPYSYKFYYNLTNEISGFKKIYETPCDVFCKITYFGNPVFAFEQTTNVFDRPTIFIFKKI